VPRDAIKRSIFPPQGLIQIPVLTLATTSTAATQTIDKTTHTSKKPTAPVHLLPTRLTSTFVRSSNSRCRSRQSLHLGVVLSLFASLYEVCTHPSHLFPKRNDFSLMAGLQVCNPEIRTTPTGCPVGPL
jgi:hypothetical protein